MDVFLLSSSAPPEKLRLRGRISLYIRWTIVASVVVLMALTYLSVARHQASATNLYTLGRRLLEPGNLPLFVPFFLLPLALLRSSHLRWIFVLCIVGGAYINWSYWQHPELLTSLFSRSHKIKRHNTFELATMLQAEESEYFRKCVAPLAFFRQYVRGSTLILPEGLTLDADRFRLHSVALIKDIVREPFASEISQEQLERFKEETKARQYLLQGCVTTKPGYIFIAPRWTSRFRVYTHERDIIVVEDGYAFK